MPKILLGVIGNGREELLAQTIASAKENLPWDGFAGKILIDDSGDRNYHGRLIEKYDTHFTAFCFHPENQGLSGSVRSLWEYAIADDYDYVFHLEDDFTFNQTVNINKLVNELGDKLAQVALKRQPCNADEAAAGGFMELNPDSYQETRRSTAIYQMGSPAPRSFTRSPVITIHRNFFTLNPSVYPRWVMELGWEMGWGEKEFGERLFVDPEVYCGYLGRIDDPPLVNHIGGYRAEGWKV